MLIAKACARWLPLLVLAPLGCLGMESRPNTLPKRTAAAPRVRNGSDYAGVGYTARNPASLASATGAPRPTPMVRPTPTPTAQLPVEVAAAIPEAPEPRVPPFNSQPTAAAAGAITPASEGPAMPTEPKPVEPKPVETKMAANGPAMPQAVEASRPSAKVPMPPGGEFDPPPMPTPASATRTPDDSSSPPPIPSVVKPSPAGSVTQQAETDALGQLRTIHKKAADRYRGMDSYVARLRRREQINGKDKPEEMMLFKFRKEPWSVYFKWLGIEGHNRECVYIRGQHGGLIHTLLAEGDVMLMPAGKRISLAPTNPLVRARSRHSITEAGIGEMIDGFGRVVAALEQGEKRYGTMKVLGQLRRPEFEKPHMAVEHLIPPGAEATLPQGGSRLYLFDPESNLPVLLITTDDTNHEVEYYCYDRIQFPVKLDDEDFNPDKLWKAR